jgi:hypothetical protein
MLAVRTPGAPHTTRTNAACDSAFPLERQGRLLRSRSISGLYSRSLHSGLQPPCLRFATAVTGRHARLGSRLLARLCRGRHLRRQTSTRLQGATLIEPDVRRYRIRLSDRLHRKAHGEAVRGKRSRASTPRSPWITSKVNCRLPRPCTLCRLARKARTRSVTYWSIPRKAGRHVP